VVRLNGSTPFLAPSPSARIEHVDDATTVWSAVVISTDVVPIHVNSSANGEPFSKISAKSNRIIIQGILMIANSVYSSRVSGGVIRISVVRGSKWGHI
jgi:hypothetical protein